jgi:LPXTG-site transpeptidase (sortase) family protein
VRIVCAVLGYALMLLGVGGLLLLSAGRFPEPLRNLLLGPPPSARFAAPADALPLEGLVPDASVAAADETPGTMAAGQAETAEDTANTAEPGAAEAAEAAAAEPIEEPAGEAQPQPAPAPSATPRPLPPTRTPAPTVIPVALTAGQTRAPITRLHVPSIRLDTEVVPARLVAALGVTTWEVPALRAGHGLHTAGAGEPGNAVLVGHVSSISHGNVFRSLDRVRPGDVVQIFSDGLGYDYVATEVKRVPRTDLAILAPTEGASVTLLTCTGQWLADVNDYAERLIVRATLVAAHQTPTATASSTPTPSPTPEPTETPEATETPAATETPQATVSPSAAVAGGPSSLATTTAAAAGPITVTIMSTGTPPAAPPPATSPAGTAAAPAAATPPPPPPATTAARTAAPAQATSTTLTTAPTASAPNAAAPTATRTAQPTAPTTPTTRP